MATPIVTLLLGDSVTLLRDLDRHALRPQPGRIFKADACVTDPPYGYDFDGNMDKEGQQGRDTDVNRWDNFVDGRRFASIADDAEAFARFSEAWIRAVEGILWPGAHLAIFAAARTAHRLGRGMELANLDIVRTVGWWYASGQVKTKTDLRPGYEPVMIGRYLGDMQNVAQLNDLFKKTGRGQLHAQTLKAEDGQHPTDVIVDESLVEAYEEIAKVVAAHPGAFFVSKASPKDRDWGCGDLPVQQKLNRLSHMTDNAHGKVVKPVMAQNIHPTVKPIELMRRLVLLTTNPGGSVIDPFMGSGTTGVAAVLEGRHFIGIEREPKYFQVAAARIASALKEVGGDGSTLALVTPEPEAATTT